MHRYRLMGVMAVMLLCGALKASAQLRLPVRLMELNCENLFDCIHDSLKNDYEFLPTGTRKWTWGKYYRKLNNIAKEIVACTDTSTMRPPDLVALSEVENDTVLTQLVRMSALRYSGYRYIMTSSPDLRGIDVALLYNPDIFIPFSSKSFRVNVDPGERPTRDVLYVCGSIAVDTFHIFVVHAPSRQGGAKATTPLRDRVARIICEAVDSIYSVADNPNIILLGDFNDYTGSKTMLMYDSAGLADISANATGSHGGVATYKYQGEWKSLDHIFVSKSLKDRVLGCKIADFPFLLEDDKTYGGYKPLRSGYRNANGFSDHLPIIADILVNAE